MRKIKILLIGTAITGNLFAQQPKATNWVTLQSPIVFNDHWQTLHEVSYRTLGESFTLNQLFVRNGIRYSFNTRWSTSLLCDLVHSRVKPADKNDLEFGDEIRLTEELIHRHPVGETFTFQHRIRIEERFFGETSLGDDYKALRLRYRLAAVKKLSPKWDLQLADEYFEQLIKSHLGFNSNRIAFSGFYRYAPNAHLEAVYYWIRFPQRSQHVFGLTYQNRIQAKHKKKTNAS